MKRIFSLLFALVVLVSMNLVAQNENYPVTMPNGNFESWSTGSGYSINTGFGSPMSVFDDYTYPTNWNFPTYHVNQSVMNMTINTDIPLMKVADETTGAPEGAHAIKMQSYMLSDIINSTVYNMAVNMNALDTAMTRSVFPTILATGAMNIDSLMTFMERFNGNFDSLPQMMSILADVNLNDLVEGGLPLNGATPSMMTGYYKYASAIGGDNGGVLMLGSKYNSATQRREVVGVGYNTSLTDTANYVPFELNYIPRSEIDTTVDYVAADSLVIMLLSSANTNPQQGSLLYLDDLRIWSSTEDSTYVEPDTCSAIFNLTVTSVDTMHATLSWTYEGTPDHFDVEYGTHGFAHGQGTMTTTNDSTITLSNLTPDTQYDVYVRCACDSTLTGAWSMVSFRTDTVASIEDTTAVDTIGIQVYTNNQLKIYPNPAQGHCTVEFEEIPTMVRLYGINGTLVMKAVPSKETMELTLPTSGVFILVCDMKDGVVMRKIINQR